MTITATDPWGSDGAPRRYETVLEWLEDARVVRFEEVQGGGISAYEMCDEYFNALLSREHMTALIGELTQLRDAMP